MFKLVAISLILFMVSASVQADTNGVVVSFNVVSDSSNRVTGPDLLGLGYAVPTWVHPNWSANIPGATWIWNSYQVSQPTSQQSAYFMNPFFIPGVPLNATLSLAADNSVWTFVNGVDVGCSRLTNSFQSSTQFSCDITPYVVNGMNMIQFNVTNLPGGASYTLNPAGLLYKISIKAIVS